MMTLKNLIGMPETFWVLTGVLSLLLLLLVYRWLSVKRFTLKTQKVQPTLSVILMVRNNQKLLELTLNQIKASNHFNNIKNIIVIDKGSVDKSCKVAESLLENDSTAKLVRLQPRFEENLPNIISQYIKGDSVLLLDLDKINNANPNVYVPDLLKPFKLGVKAVPTIDSRIYGLNLISFDDLERNKNSYIMNRYVLDPLSNIRMNLEVMQREQIGPVAKQITELLQYVDQSLREAMSWAQIMGPAKSFGASVHEGLISLFRDYSRNYWVSIDYRLFGKEKPVEENLSNLLLGASRDLLYVLLSHNLITAIQVRARFSSKQFRVLVKYETELEEKALFMEEYRQLILQSISNRLSLVGGSIAVKSKKGEEIVLLHIPL